MFKGNGWEKLEDQPGTTVIDRPFWVIDFQHGGRVVYSGRSTVPLSPPSDGVVLKIENKVYRVISSVIGTTPLQDSHVWGDFVTHINVRIEPK